MELFLIYPGCRYALPWAMRFCAFSATITNMNFRIRIFNFCTSNCTPYTIAQILELLLSAKHEKSV